MSRQEEKLHLDCHNTEMKISEKLWRKELFGSNHVHKNERSGQTDDKVLFKVCYQAAVLSWVERNSVQLEHSLKHRQTFTVSLFKVFVTFNFQKKLWPTLHEIGMRVHVVYLIF